MLVTHDVAEAVALADRVLLIEDQRVALDEWIGLARPRLPGPGFAGHEQRLLDRVLQRPPAEPEPPDPHWPPQPAHGLRWAV